MFLRVILMSINSVPISKILFIPNEKYVIILKSLLTILLNEKFFDFFSRNSLNVKPKQQF